jgi:hypothetical protein
MDWTTDRPTVPGYYWHRHYSKPWYEPVIVDVRLDGFSELHVFEIGIPDTAPLEQWRGTWKGPIVCE